MDILCSTVVTRRERTERMHSKGPLDISPPCGCGTRRRGKLFSVREATARHGSRGLGEVAARGGGKGDVLHVRSTMLGMSVEGLDERHGVQLLHGYQKPTEAETDMG